MALNRRNENAIIARGLDPELAIRYGIADASRTGFDIEIPFLRAGELVNRKYRNLPKRDAGGNFAQDKDGKQIFWNYDVMLDASLDHMPIIITEGEMDALAAIQCGFVRTMSVPNGAPAETIGDDENSKKYSYLDDVTDRFRECREIVLCVDGDAPGTNLLTDLSLRLGRARCRWIKYPKGCKDLNDALVRYGQRGVVETINRAAWAKVDGVYSMSGLPPLPESHPYEIGMAGLEKHYRMRLGDLCVVTGVPSSGKSAFIGDISGRMVENYGWNIAMASFEQRPQIDHRRQLRTFYNRRRVIDQTAEEISGADRWIDEHFAFVVPSEDDDVTLDWVLDRMAVAVIRNGCKLIVVDPFNEMDHIRPNGMSMTEYTGFALKQFRKFAAKFRVHFILAAHPAKMYRDKDGKIPIPGLYDISDSANFANKCDVGIVIHRNRNKTLIRIAKTRYHDQIGVPGDLDAIYLADQARYEIIDPAAEEHR